MSTTVADGFGGAHDARPRTWTDHPVISIDCETTGVDPWEARIVQIAAALIQPDGTVTGTWTTIIDPGVDIPDQATQIHGITTEQARTEGMPPAQALEALAAILAANPPTPVVAFNAAYDWPLILCEAVRHGVNIDPGRMIIDPHIIDKHCTPRRSGKGSRKLTHVAALYGVEFTGAAHGALADAIAAGQLLYRLADEHVELAVMSLPDLWLSQIRWQAEQVDSLEQFFRKETPDRTLSRGWPIPAY